MIFGAHGLRRSSQTSLFSYESRFQRNAWCFLTTTLEHVNSFMSSIRFFTFTLSSESGNPSLSLPPPLSLHPSPSVSASRAASGQMLKQGSAPPPLRQGVHVINGFFAVLTALHHPLRRGLCTMFFIQGWIYYFIRWIMNAGGVDGWGPVRTPPCGTASSTLAATKFNEQVQE